MTSFHIVIIVLLVVLTIIFTTLGLCGVFPSPKSSKSPQPPQPPQSPQPSKSPKSPQPAQPDKPPKSDKPPPPQNDDDSIPETFTMMCKSTENPPKPDIYMTPAHMYINVSTSVEEVDMKYFSSIEFKEDIQTLWSFDREAKTGKGCLYTTDNFNQKLYITQYRVKDMDYGTYSLTKNQDEADDFNYDKSTKQFTNRDDSNRHLNLLSNMGGGKSAVWGVSDTKNPFDTSYKSPIIVPSPIIPHTFTMTFKSEDKPDLHMIPNEYNVIELRDGLDTSPPKTLWSFETLDSDTLDSDTLNSNTLSGKLYTLNNNGKLYLMKVEDKGGDDLSIFKTTSESQGASSFQYHKKTKSVLNIFYHELDEEDGTKKLYASWKSQDNNTHYKKPPIIVPPPMPYTFKVTFKSKSTIKVGCTKWSGGEQYLTIDNDELATFSEKEITLWSFHIDKTINEIRQFYTIKLYTLQLISGQKTRVYLRKDNEGISGRFLNTTDLFSASDFQYDEETKRLVVCGQKGQYTIGSMLKNDKMYAAWGKHDYQYADPCVDSYETYITDAAPSVPTPEGILMHDD